MCAKRLTCVCLLLATTPALADFQFQLDARAARGELDFDNNPVFEDTENEAGALAGRYYFTPVSPQDYPFREAAFLGKQSSVTLSVLRDKQTEPDTSDDTRQELAVDVDVRIGQTPFRVGGFYLNSSNDVAGYDARALGGRFGWHIQQSSLLTFTGWFEGGEYDVAGDSNDDGGAVGFAAAYRQVLPVSGSHIAFGGGVGWAGRFQENRRADEDDYADGEFEVNGFFTWYVNRKFGFGVEYDLFVFGYDEDRLDNLDGFGLSTLALTGSYDFNQNIGLDLRLAGGAGGYAVDAGEDVDASSTSGEIGIQIRF